MAVTEQQVLDALRVVRDPDLHKDIVTLNFVKAVKIDGPVVAVTIELTTPACPVKDLLLNGSDDTRTSHVSMQAIADRIQDATFEVISNGSHVPPLERPEETVRRLRRFLNGLEAPAPWPKAAQERSRLTVCAPSAGRRRGLTMEGNGGNAC